MRVRKLLCECWRRRVAMEVRRFSCGYLHARTATVAPEAARGDACERKQSAAPREASEDIKLQLAAVHTPHQIRVVETAHAVVNATMRAIMHFTASELSQKKCFMSRAVRNHGCGIAQPRGRFWRIARILKLDPPFFYLRLRARSRIRIRSIRFTTPFPRHSQRRALEEGFPRLHSTADPRSSHPGLRGGGRRTRSL